MQKRIKVVHLVEWLELGGGIERIVGEIAAGLDPKVYEVEIWCLARAGRLVEVYRRQGLTVKVFNITTYHNPANIIKLVQLFRSHRPDIIHMHMYFASTLSRIAGLLASVPVMINHVHSTYWHYSRINLWVERILSLVTARIICVSNNVRDFVVAHERINPKKIEVIYNGISAKVPVVPRDHMRASLSAGPQDIVLVAVGSLFENKGHKVLLEAVAQLKGRVQNLKCWIVGEGEMGPPLKELAKKLRIESQVNFLGLRADVADILQAGDIFVLPSLHREGLPVSVLEALAAGLPVIASRVGGVGEIISDGKNGALVNPQDQDDLARTIEELTFNAAKRESLAREGGLTFEKSFTVAKMAGQIEQLYQKCIKQ